MIILLILLLHFFGHGQTEKVKQNELTVIPAEFTSVESPWELRRKQDDISIYQRWVEVEPNRKARELYAETESVSKPEELAKIIRSEKYGTEWLSMADEYKIIGQVSENEWYAYSRFKFMPALKFDLITRNEMKFDPVSHTVSIGIYGKPDYLPEEKNYRRLSHFEGKWEFTPSDSAHTRIRYYLFSRTKPFLPRWTTDPVVMGELENCITNVRKIAARHE